MAQKATGSDPELLEVGHMPQEVQDLVGGGGGGGLSEADLVDLVEDEASDLRGAIDTVVSATFATFDSGTRTASSALGFRRLHRFGPFVWLTLTLSSVPAETYSIEGVCPDGTRPSVPTLAKYFYAGEVVNAFFEANDGTLYCDDGFPAGVQVTIVFPTADAEPDPADLEDPF